MEWLWIVFVLQNILGSCIDNWEYGHRVPTLYPLSFFIICITIGPIIEETVFRGIPILLVYIFNIEDGTYIYATFAIAFIAGHLYNCRFRTWVFSIGLLSQLTTLSILCSHYSLLIAILIHTCSNAFILLSGVASGIFLLETEANKEITQKESLDRTLKLLKIEPVGVTPT